MINKGNYWIFMIATQHVIRGCERRSVWDGVLYRDTKHRVWICKSGVKGKISGQSRLKPTLFYHNLGVHIFIYFFEDNGKHHGYNFVK